MSKKPKPKVDHAAKCTQTRARLASILWHFRHTYSHAPIVGDLDRINHALAFKYELTDEKLADILVSYQTRIQPDFFAALLVLVQDTVRLFAEYLGDAKLHRKIHARIVVLEKIARAGEAGCELVPDKVRSWRLVVKK